MPTVALVTRWPGQTTSDAKVPSSVLYQHTEAIAFGYEADSQYKENPDQLGYCRHFKLHMHPKNIRQQATDLLTKFSRRLLIGDSSTAGDDAYFAVERLPENVTIKQVYTDYLRFLLTSTKQFFVDSKADAAAIWTRLSVTADFVIAVPNGNSSSEDIRPKSG